MSEMNLYMPPEWHPHEGTWLAWPANDETWVSGYEKIGVIWLEMIRHLLPYEKVYLLVKDDKTEAWVKKHTSDFVGADQLIILRIPYNDSWLRDSGPNFVFNRKNGAGDLLVQDFIFNAWGNKYEPWSDDDAIPQHAARFLKLPCIDRKFVLEGGSIDTNGAGTLLTTTQCLLNRNRNPHLSQAEIADRLREYLGVQQILWLEDGIEGDDTDGHVDDITRFVNKNTIVTVVESNPQDANYEPLQRNLQLLRSSRDVEGHAFRVIELPMPHRLEGPFGRSPASYANFYIANHVVLVPIYSCDKDALALEILQSLFPDRKVVGIECTALVQGLGSIHCVTQQQPSSQLIVV